MNLYSFYQAVRNQTLQLTRNLSPEDMTAQSMTDASPAKWHLAHTTWFFEEFILRRHAEGYRPFDESFRYLFNSYYESVGERHPRPDRGLLTRPPLSAVLDYRAHVDSHMEKVADDSLRDILITGLHHEMQHQELLLTDILHLLSANPLNPAVFDGVSQQAAGRLGPLQWQEFEGGLVEIGSGDQCFSYDCERPRHRYYLQPFALASRPVSNAEWLEFIEDGGYQNPLLWLADGWAACQRNGWQAPLYWRQIDGRWWQFGLDGLQPIEPAAPVSHVSYYEADAYARWAGRRLPLEQEWEHSVAGLPIEGNFLESSHWRPRPCGESGQLLQAFGDVWEWTCSPFMPYPGFRPENGALQEYNGKFMANQFVLRGGSCATPEKQLRASYRNFFYPDQRWQFSGLRLAHDRN